MTYAELQVTTNYSFLRGASHVEELFLQAKLLGLPALGITDRNSLAGMVRAHQRAEESGVRLVVGCRLDLIDGTSLLVYPTRRAAYSRLCRLLSLGKSRAGKGECELAWHDLVAYDSGLITVLLPDDRSDTSNELKANLQRLRADFGDRAYLALTLRRRPNDAVHIRSFADLAEVVHVPTVATGDVLYHIPERRILQDAVTCIREGCTIDHAGFRRERFVDGHLKSPEEMARLFSRHPQAVARTLEIVERCGFSLAQLCYQYPDEVQIPGFTPQQALEKLAWESVPTRYPEGLPPEVEKQLHHELALIAELQYAPYFLTVHNIVRYARSKNILCQGRGSAANSVVCYVLDITSVDPVRSNLLFERFVSAERREPPDIDVDFEHERREEVIQWVYQHYGHNRAALCATVMRFRARGAVREVGKAIGLPEDVTSKLASQVWGWGDDVVEATHAAELNLNMNDRRLALTLSLARQLIGFPRHLGQHPGGFVLTESRLDDLVPIEPASMKDRRVIEWDKDDIDILRFMKVDVLGLGMLGCMRRAFDLLAEHRGIQLDMGSIPAEDPETFAMIQRADTLGVFQIESRAQMSMLPRMKPREFYDLVIEVAVVRPGPIQGDMVHSYLRRREGREPVEYPTPALERVLSKTLGVPLFQEQAMQVAIVAAGFTPTEADALRRSMATFKFTGGVSHFRDKLIAGMIARGHTQDYAERTFKQIEGFGSYGFPESHAASFAFIAYVSSWLKCHHPDVFCCALLNSQPMGFYAPAQVVRDACEHGVEIRPVSVNTSHWDCTLEPTQGDYLTVRLGLRMVKGLAEDDVAKIVATRGKQLYSSIDQLWRRTKVSVSALERLAEADAFQCFGLDRRQALWAVRGLSDTILPLFAAVEATGLSAIVEKPVSLMSMTLGREVVEDYSTIGLTLRRHPVTFLRSELARGCIVHAAELSALRPGRSVTIAGLVLVRQRPGSAKGVMFITIEDETGYANLIVWPTVFERQRHLILAASMIACYGRLQREGEVIHVVAERFDDLSDLLRSVGNRAQDLPTASFPMPHGRGDQAKIAGSPDPREQPKTRGGQLSDFSSPALRVDNEIKVQTRNFR